MTDPSTSSADEFAYVDKTNGRAVTFTPKLDEAMVTFRERMEHDALTAVVEQTPRLSVSEGINADSASPPCTSNRPRTPTPRRVRWRRSPRSRTPCP